MSDLFLDTLNLDDNGIYSMPFTNKEQESEMRLRESVANNTHPNYLDEISRNHSIPVMDKEVNRFLAGIPKNGKIIDVGGCWGWHWRSINKNRPDITVYIVDFVKANLLHAKNIIGDKLNKQIFLIHADATTLPFESETFDGYWTVQTLQHIPNFKKTIEEAHRVLKKGGALVNYSLNNQSGLRVLYKLLGKKYHVKGHIEGAFFLERLSSEQITIVEEIFKSKTHLRYSEILFKPELKIFFPGKANPIGKLDSVISNHMFGSSIARQKSFEIKK